MLEILRTLEGAFRLRLTGVFPGAGGVCRETVYANTEDLRTAAARGEAPRCLVVYETERRTLLRLELGACFWGVEGGAVAVSRISWWESPYGPRLYAAFLDRVAREFRQIPEKHYGPFLLSPAVYQRRHSLVLDLHDPRFRVSRGEEAVHVWRKEWEALLDQWGREECSQENNAT